jgi:hypothetical protein
MSYQFAKIIHYLTTGTPDGATRRLILMQTLLIALSTLSAPASANVITDWNTIASATIVAQGGKPSAAGGVWFAYEAIAVYDAVNSVHHEFQPFYYYNRRAPADASDEAAAIAAAHRVLVNYFPAQQSTLDTEFTSSVAAISDPTNAKDDGVVVGEAAAAALISARTNDGLEAKVSYTPGSSEPGVWQPTPPSFLPAATPWLGQMRPFTMTSASQFLPDGPSALTSPQWVHDYNLTATLGEVDSTVRTPAQTEIGLFWTEHGAQQYSRAFGYLAENYQLSTMDSARLFAILWTGFADAAIGCFNAKYTYSFWRPVTAVQAGGGNPSLLPDNDWLPLGITPNHPEYPAAHGCVSGALSDLVKDFFGTPNVHFVVDSHAFSPAHTHVFEDTREWFHEVFWARIYAGFHYYHSLKDGADLGRNVSNQLFHHYFQPLVGER